MKIKICPGCQQEKPIKAKGLCAACYIQQRRTDGLVRVHGPRGTCTIEGCDKPLHGRGMCGMHLKRLKVSGSLDDPRADNVNLMTNQKLYSQWSAYQKPDANPIDPVWKADFFAFQEGVGARPSVDHRLYRIDKTKPMQPGNFEWRAKLITRDPDESNEEYNARHRRERRKVLGVGSWDSELRRKYGADFGLRELRVMAEAQNHCCAICGAAEKEERNGLVRHLAVDHDHRPGGKVRELLCQHCNKGLGCFKDDTSVMLKAIAYLIKHDALYVPPTA